ncbi:MAG: glycoside hydrolase family 3 C-terminal domain-containing protein [Paludibacteraceae bacterium]|nr:glycoside hydrolase family 3 C-terminal domain-containing protein [Paludibacteraceae bacterium]
MKSRIFLLIALVAMVSCQSKDPVERRIDKLLSQMTLEEKIAQMTQVCGGQISDNIADQIRNGAGSMLNSVGAEADYYQHIAVEESRLGIPMIFARDVIHGFRTIFPIPLGQAATFDPDIVEEGARIAAEEAVQAGLRWTFSPMVDVARDPRWGRVAEGYGEDTYLASVMGAAAVRGYQGNDSVVRMAACVKHFAGYAVSEGGRDYNSTWIPEVQLRETYLPPFKAAIDAGSLSIMCAFNDLNGVPASGNKHLNVDILREEWQFDGVLVSDWASLQNMNNQGNSANLKEATKLCANAQMDMDMESKGYPRHLKELVEEGEVSEDIIDNCVRNILRMKFRLGLFDNPYCYTEDPEYFTPEALSAAQKAAEESAVLLKNNGILPLNNNSKLTVLVCGPMANAPHEQNGTWCFDKDDAMTITPMMAFRELAKDGKVRLIEQTGEHWSREFNKENITTLVRLAKQADVVLYFGGEESILSGEARSRAVLNLPGDQSEQIRAIKATGKPVVLTVMAGRPLCIKEDIDRVDAVLYAFHGGTMQGPALANLIMGKVAPSGRLPMTFPMGEGQIPFYYNYKMPSRLMAKSPKLINDIPVRAYQFSVGETSYWLEYGNKPLYPFGYGLTYTTFEYGAVQLSDTILSLSGAQKSIIASCEITNTGHCDAVAVPQLYIRDVVGTLTRPLRELKGFQRVNIPAGETRTVSFEISEQDLAYWHLAEGVALGSDGEYAFSAEKGDFHVWIAPNAAEGQYIPFTLVE